MKNKSGVALPLVLFLLVILALIGIAMNRSVMHEYRYTHRSADHLRAVYIAEAAVQAVLAQIKEGMNGNDADLRDKIVTKTDAVKDFLDFNDLKSPYKDEFTALEKLLNDNDSDANVIDKGEFKVKKINTTLSACTYLQDTADKKYGDRTRRLTVTVALEYTGSGRGSRKLNFTKKISQSFDLKIADVRPVGNRFVMMVAKITDSEKDFNNGGHFYVNNKGENDVSSDGISIGNDGKESVIQLFPRYSGHEDWEKCARGDKIKDGYADIVKDMDKANSPESLIPGWDEGKDAAFKPEDPFVPDNEPWEKIQILSESKNKNELGNLTGVIPGPGPGCTSCGSPDVHNKSTEKRLLNTGNGCKVENNTPADPVSNKGCGLGVKWQKDFTHPIFGKPNDAFFNSGFDEGRTHLFFKNCSVPAPIFGKVKKSWVCFKYLSEKTGDTGSAPYPCEISRATCTYDDDGNLLPCQHHRIYPKEDMWDTNDTARIEEAKKSVKGDYRVKQGKWSDYNPSAVTIDVGRNMKSQSNFDNSAFVKESFLSGATRRVQDPAKDKTLLDGKQLFLEGVLEITESPSLDVVLNNPGMIISQKDIALISSKYDPPKNPFFKQKTVLSVVGEKKVVIGKGRMDCGVCCSEPDSDGDISLLGNLTAKSILCSGQKKIQGALKYDSIFKSDEYLVDDVGVPDQKCSFVVTISPIPCEYFTEF